MTSGNRDERVRAEIERLAQAHRDAGSEVLMQPAPGSLPEFLAGFQPDLLVHTRDGQHYAIEVKGSKQRRSPEWEAMVQALSKHEGWQAHLVVVPDEGEAAFLTIASVPWERIVDAYGRRIDSLLTKDVMATASRESRLLEAWAIFEGAARARLQRDGNEPARATTPLGILRQLVSLGYLDEQQAAEVRALATVRNYVAHGAVLVEIPSIDPILNASRTLLSEKTP